MSRLFVGAIGLVGILTIGALAWAQAQQQPAEKRLAPALSGKPILIMTKDHIATTLEKPEVRQLGMRTFVVGREVISFEGYKKYTNPQYGGATVWVPVDTVTELIELEPIKPEK